MQEEFNVPPARRPWGARVAREVLDAMGTAVLVRSAGEPALLARWGSARILTSVLRKDVAVAA
jgi:hypothetical protein